MVAKSWEHVPPTPPVHTSLLSGESAFGSKDKKIFLVKLFFSTGRPSEKVSMCGWFQ